MRRSLKGRPRKLSDADVEDIRRLCALRRQLQSKVLAARFGVSRSVIDYLASGHEYKQAWRGGDADVRD